MSSNASMSPTSEEREARLAAATTTTAHAHAHAHTDADAAAAWAFYESGLVHDTSDGGADDEDTDDELETADWIRFQRARAQSRLLAARQHEQQQQQLQQRSASGQVNARAGSP